MAKNGDPRVDLNRKLRVPLILYLMIGVLGILVTATVVYSFRTSMRMITVYSPLMGASMEIRLGATSGHLWFEEILSGDQTENMEKVWSCYNSSEWYARSMLEGGANHKGVYLPLQDTLMREEIEKVLIALTDFRIITQQRLEESKRSGPGSDIDQKYDMIFSNFTLHAERVESRLQEVIGNDLGRYRSMQWILIGMSSVMVLFAIFIFLRFQRGQLGAFRAIGKANTNLENEIIERKQAEESVRRSEEWLSTTLTSIGDAVIAADMKGAVTFLNPVAQMMTGWREKDAKGKPLQEVFNIINEYTKQPAENPVDRVFKEGKVVGLANHTVLIAKDGTLYPIDDSAAPIKDLQGEIIGAVLVFHDISERRKSEMELRESEQKYHTLFNEMIDGFALHEIVLDEEGNPCDYRFLEANRSFENLTGLKRDLIIGKTALEIIPGLEKYWIDTYGEVALTGKSTRFENYSAELGKHFEVVAFSPRKNRFATVFVDITDRKNAEKALADEKERLAVTLSSIGDAVIATDTEGLVVVFNGVAQSLTGWPKDEAIGRPLDEVFNIINEITKEKCESPIEKVLKTGKVVGLANHTTLISRDGSELYIADSGAPIKDKNGDIIGVVLVFRDVTETRRLREFAERAQRLETAGRIAGQVAHDFNNLLGPLMAYPELIRDELPEGHSALPFLSDMEKSAEKIAEINMQLLTLGRRGHYNQVPMNLNQVVRDTIRDRSPLPPKLIVNTDYDTELMNINGGAAQLHRVLLNLLINAFEAMDNIGQVAIKTENYYADSRSRHNKRIPRGEYVKLTISDDGPGVPPEVLPRIFDPFFTTKASDRQKGSGLGLSIVHAVVEDHNGYIDVESKLGQGTSFYLYFPITRDGSESVDSARVVGGSENILIVDDDETQRTVGKALLSKLGYKCHCVESGKEAIEYLRDNKCELLILDMIMPPGIDGAETFAEALKIESRQRAIIVSGYAESERVQDALQMGAGGFIRKPLTLKTIAIAVRKELDRKEDIHN